MTRILLIFAFFLSITLSKAQLPDGSIAPDFTVIDVHGNSHHLYGYLEQGYTVYLDLFATWCGPCWSHHQGGAFEQLYTDYGPDGTNEIIVIAVEVDSRTNVPCLYGPSGCTYGTQGDWVTGTPYGMANDNSLNSLYAVSYFPTIYGICPNKRLTELRQRSSSEYYDWHLSNCALSLEHVETTDVLCFDGNDGTIAVMGSGGTEVYTYTWSNGETGATVRNLAAGEYFCTLSDGGRSVVGGPYFVNEPEVLEVVLEEWELPSCDNNVSGKVDIEIEGGVWPHIVEWNDGEEGQHRTGMQPGTYTYTVTDGHDCKLFSKEKELEGISIPASLITPDSSFCEASDITLSVREGREYEWSTGENTQSIEVNVYGDETYYVTVTYLDGCKVEDSVQIESLNLPTSGNGQEVQLDCHEDDLLIHVQESESHDLNYFWEAVDGSVIEGSTNEYNLGVTNPGVYRVTVIDEITGCSNTALINVIPDEKTPTIDVSIIGEIDCINNTVVLDASNSSNGENFSFQWSSTNTMEDGNTLAPTISGKGVYNLTIVNTDEDCENSKNILIEYGTIKAPDVSIGFALDNNTIQFYNASKHIPEGYHWLLPDGSTSYELSPSMSNSALGSTVVICLEPDNKCGLTEMRCQTLDLDKSTYYFTGAVKDQFNQVISNVQFASNGTAPTDVDGVYLLENLVFDTDLMVSPSINNTQTNDVNEYDLLFLIDVLLGKANIVNPYLINAADINEDGELNFEDVVLLKQSILGQANPMNIGAWVIRDEQCASNSNKDLILDCNPFIELKLLQASHLHNDFIAIQKGDLSTDENGNGMVGVRKNSIDFGVDNTQEIDLIKGRMLSLTIDGITDPSRILIDGKTITSSNFVVENNSIRILKVYSEDRPTARIEVLDSKTIEVNGSNTIFSIGAIEVLPNPVSSNAVVNFNSAESGLIDWELIDLYGNKIISKSNYSVSSGLNIWNIDFNNYATGIYILVVTQDESVSSKKIVVSN